jgi:hypothetical protein
VTHLAAPGPPKVLTCVGASSSVDGPKTGVQGCLVSGHVFVVGATAFDGGLQDCICGPAGGLQKAALEPRRLVVPQEGGFVRHSNKGKADTVGMATFLSNQPSAVHLRDHIQMKRGSWPRDLQPTGLRARWQRQVR